MAAGDEEVAVAVVVEVDEAAAPVHVGQAPVAGAGGERDVLEQAVAEVAVEHGQLALVGGHEEVEPAVVVVVAAVDAHAARARRRARRRPRRRRAPTSSNLPVPVVLEEEIRRHVVGDEDVGVAVVVVVGADDAHAGAGVAADARLAR